MQIAFKSSGTGKDDERDCEFLLALMSAANQIVRFKLYGETEDHKHVVWEPFSSPVGDWVKENRIISLIWEKEQQSTIDHDYYQWVLVGKILSFHDTERVIAYTKRTSKSQPKLTIVR